MLASVFGRVVRRVAGRGFSENQEQIFRQYLRKAEEIQHKASQTKEVEQPKKESPPRPEPRDPVSAFLNRHQVVAQINTAKSIERVQLILEDALYKASLQYKDSENQSEAQLTPGTLGEKLMLAWNERPDTTLFDYPLSKVLRNVLISPVTEVKESFGTFQRISKEAQGSYSPFFYGPLTETMYLSLITGVHDSKQGVQVLRRILDHMHAFNYTPSKELLQNMITESIQGYWPRIMKSILDFGISKQIPISLEIWKQCISFYTNTHGYFEKAHELIEQAIQVNQTFDFSLIEPIVFKYQRHDMHDKALETFMEMRERIIKTSPTKNTIPSQVGNLYLQYMKMLVKSQNIIDAQLLWYQYQEEKIEKSEEGVLAGFELFLYHQDTFEIPRFLNYINTEKGLPRTAKILARLLQLCAILADEGVEQAMGYEHEILSNPNLYSTTALNILIVIYGKAMQWEQLQNLLRQISKDYKVNDLTAKALQRVLNQCNDHNVRKAIVRIAKDIKFPTNVNFII